MVVSTSSLKDHGTQFGVENKEIKNSKTFNIRYQLLLFKFQLSWTCIEAIQNQRNTSITNMTNTDLSVASLFNVDGLVALVTGGGTGILTPNNCFSHSSAYQIL